MNLLRHSVLVTQPISADAMARLKTFFDVDSRIEEDNFSEAEFLSMLRGKAGVMTDSRHVFGAALLAEVPTLKAVCSLDAFCENFDLAALTNAGVRATNTPFVSTRKSLESLVPRWGAKPSLNGLVMDALGEGEGDGTPNLSSDDPSRIAAENLVASLGFGRFGWHPPHLLNTEILCESCC